MKKLLLVLAGILVVLAACHSPLDSVSSDSARQINATNEQGLAGEGTFDEAATRATTTSPKPPAGPSIDAEDPGSKVYPFAS